jgi:hopene-associated glycosyltransferase HpnB
MGTFLRLWAQVVARPVARWPEPATSGGPACPHHIGVQIELAVAVVALAAWIGIALHPARPWDLRPIAEDDLAPPAPSAWPSVGVVVPARNESGSLPETLPALLAQDYPGHWWVVVVDDRSSDDTAAVARRLGGRRVQVLTGGPLPDGWAGKVWAMAQGAKAGGTADYLWLTDADIRHGPGSLRRLVAESEAWGLALNSRMARLRARSAAERLLIPPFLFFFNLLYPMRWVNGPGATAAAAGGCILVRRRDLERAGGFAVIRGEIIDDVHLASAIKHAGGRIRLAVSRGEVASVRAYGGPGPLWRMVRRSAFDQLGYSWALLVGTLAGLGLLFAVPPLSVVAALVGWGVAGLGRLALGLIGVAAWGLMTLVFTPSVALFEISPAWSLTLPLGGLLYAAMTLDSALRHAAGRRQEW